MLVWVRDKRCQTQPFELLKLSRSPRMQVATMRLQPAGQQLYPPVLTVDSLATCRISMDYLCAYGGDAIMCGIRHAPNASTAGMREYSYLQAGCSRITPTTTRAEQRTTSIGHGWHRLPHLASVTAYERRWKHAWNAPRAQRVCRVHGRLQLLAGWMQPHHTHHHAC